MSHFQRDKTHEEIIANWLDKFFYSRLDIFEVGHKRVEEVKEWKRIKEAQSQGIDIVLKDKCEEIYFVDEKSQTTYLNKPLPTFAFEISYEKDGKPRRGWLVDDSKVTSHYILVYPRSETISSYKELKNWRDIDFAEILFINKDRLMTELYNLGINKELLLESADNIEIENKNVPIKGISKEFVGLYKSGKLAEKPVNIVVKRSILDNVASAIWKVHKDKIDVVKTFNEYWIKDD